jgi:hypothetical protein
MSDELGVGGMVGRLDAHDSGLESAIPLLHIPEEMELRLRWAHEEDLGATVESACDLVEEPMLVIGMIPDSHLLLLGMAMNVRAWCLDDGCVYRLAVNLENACLLGVNPNDRVLHDYLLCGRQP